MTIFDVIGRLLTIQLTIDDPNKPLNHFILGKKDNTPSNIRSFPEGETVPRNDEIILQCFPLEAIEQELREKEEIKLIGITDNFIPIIEINEE